MPTDLFQPVLHAHHRRDRPCAAEPYGFTDEELDFTINYDIKYRLGADEGDDG